ncbi:MAG: hypothetical protein EOM20_18955 [Spartobacteria bacterium]|nr:hypothetical protein [Spartobacteria bacterium]
MRITYLLFPLLSCVCIPLAVAQQPSRDVVADYFKAGALKLDVGTAATLYQYEEKGKSDPGVAFGFLQLRYTTPERGGLQFGAWGLAAKDLWENHNGDYDALYTQDSDLRELYARWKIPATKTTIRGGRFGLVMTGLDGNSHQAVEICSEDIPHLSLRAAVINRWINNDRVDMYYKGITGWEDVDDVSTECGNEFWMGTATITLGELGTLEPFIGYQEHLMMLYGTDINLAHTVAEGQSIGLDAILAMYGNKTPDEGMADYGDVFSWLAHVGYTVDNITAGIGWYGVSDDEAHIAAGIFDTFDPLDEDMTIPYDDQNHAQLYYVDLNASFKAVTIALAYGYGVNKAVDVDSHEIDAALTGNITPSVQWAVFSTYNRYSGDLLSNYLKSGLSLTYSY